MSPRHWGGAGLGGLCQDQAARQIDDKDPLEPVAPRQSFAPIVHAVDEAGADRSGRQAGAIHRHCGAVRWRRRHPTNRRRPQAGEIVLARATHATIQRRRVGHPLDGERGAQFGMLAPPHLRVAVGPIFIAHQTPDRQQRGLGKRVLGARAAIAGQGGFGNLPCHLREADDAYLGLGNTSVSPVRTGRTTMSTRPDHF